MKTHILAAMVAMACAAPATAEQNARLSVVFEADSDALTSQGRAQIAAFARDHKTAQDDSVRVEGHANPGGILRELPGVCRGARPAQGRQRPIRPGRGRRPARGDCDSHIWSEPSAPKRAGRLGSQPSCRNLHGGGARLVNSSSVPD